VGDPAQVLPPNEHERIWEIQRELDFPGTVFGFSRDTPDLMPRTTRKYAELFATHCSDKILPDA
jgi:hypothetical protein